LKLEFFRPDHGHEQINKEEQRDNADDDGFHLYSYSFSQNSVYSTPTIKNATTVPTKIKSLTDHSFAFSQNREYSPFTPRIRTIPMMMNSLIRLT